MSITRPYALTAPERVRTVLAGCLNLRVRVPSLTLEIHRHGLTPDGSVLFQAPPDLELGAAEAVAIDVSAVPQSDRIRGEVYLRGSLDDVREPLPAGMRAHLTGSDDPGVGRLVQLDPDDVVLDWRCEDAVGRREIPLTAYRSAFPDPLVAYEHTWLPHLQADHAEVLGTMARHELGLEPAQDEAVDVRALGLDRYGVVLRVHDGRSRYDLRIPFDRPVACGCDVREAFGSLVQRTGLGPIC
jgi:hypothetical protein